MILVTGATGNVGRCVVAQARESGAAVRALIRTPDKAGVLPGHVEIVQGDLSVPGTLPDALDGVTAAFLFAVPGSAPGVIEAARAKGVRRIVFLSSAAVRDDAGQQPDAIAAFHADIEHALEGSGLEWTFVRPGSLAVNALQWAPQVRGGTVFAPYPGATTAPVHERDVAAVAVRALTSDEHIGAKLEVTGPQSLSQADQADVIGEVIGREVRIAEVPPAAARQQMVQYIPEPVADALLAGWERSVGRAATIRPTVQKVTGRAPRTFREWVSDHAAEFLG